MKEQDLFPFNHAWLSDMDKSLAQTLRSWAETEVMAKRLEHREDHEQLLEPAMRKLFLDIGMQRLLWPEPNGGDGHNGPEAAFTMVAALEQVSRADTGIAFTLACTAALQASIALSPGLREDACAAIGGIFSDSQVSLASLVLPVFGSEAQLTAKRQKGNWVVKGDAVRPLNSGSDGAVFGVFCAVEDEPGESVFLLIPADSKGVQRAPAFLKTGLAASRNADVTFDAVKVPESQCAFSGDEGIQTLLSWLRLGVSACCVGALMATREILQEWGDTRVIKGKGQVFKENPLTAALMADVAREASLSRMLTYNVASYLADPEQYGPGGEPRNAVTAGMVSQYVAATAEKCINNAMELMASAGYAREWNLERYWRDVKTMQSSMGPDQLNKLSFSRYFYACRTL
ncbi:MAG: acyl-CoA dehydrogenase family protein [Candidatus Geothermincolia bacterium]